jgi:exosome complex component RRP42
MEYREVSVENNPIPRANGSARVKIGNTEVIVGVKMDVSTPFPDTPEEGTLMINTELMPMANPDFEPGPPKAEAIELSRVVDRGIRESGCIDFGKLCITPKEKVWTVFVDVYPINDDGNLLDAAALAAVTALKNTVIPKYDEKEGVVMHKEPSKKKLELEFIPVLTTFGKIGGHLFADFDLLEQHSMDARLSLSSMPNGKIAAMQKGGFGTFSEQEILNLVDLAVEKGKELRKLIK